MKTFVPMLPEQIPQQRLNKVVSLPDRPKNFQVNVDYDVPLKINRPIGSPRKLIYLCGVEWAWSPAHNRMDHYYLNLKPNQYFLWNHYLDDLSTPWRWEWLFLSYANKCDKDFKKISTHMLIDFWEKERDFQGLDHYHLIDKTDLLDAEGVEAIARERWEMKIENKNEYHA